MRLARLLLGNQTGDRPKDLCWFGDCKAKFTEEEATYCPKCDTYRCPTCKRCYCDLPEEAKTALDAEMSSLGYWNPFSNPPRRKKRGLGRRLLEEEWLREYPYLAWEEFIERKHRGEI
ncbi:MAG: hypothetical protein QW356_04700 [Candidatus Hadarchaeales archaeon]